MEDILRKAKYGVERTRLGFYSIYENGKCLSKNIEKELIIKLGGKNKCGKILNLYCKGDPYEFLRNEYERIKDEEEKQMIIGLFQDEELEEDVSGKKEDEKEKIETFEKLKHEIKLQLKQKKVTKYGRIQIEINNFELLEIFNIKEIIIKVKYEKSFMGNNFISKYISYLKIDGENVKNTIKDSGTRFNTDVFQINGFEKKMNGKGFVSNQEVLLRRIFKIMNENILN